MDNLKISGKKVMLRLLAPEDIAQVCAWRNDPKTAALFYRQHIDPAAFAEEVAELHASANKDIFAVVDASDSSLLGTISYEIRKGSGELYTSLGIMIGDMNSRGKGYGSDAIVALVRYLSENHGIKSIVVEVKPENTDAVAFYKRIGFIEKAVVMSKRISD